MGLLKSIFLLIITMVYTATFSYSEPSIKDKLNALVDGLNDPDPIVRIATFEDTMKLDDATAKRIALRTALQSKDSDLRALALRGALVGRNLIAFTLSAENEKEPNEKSQQFLKNYSNNIPIQIEKYDFKTGILTGFCMTNLSSPNKNFRVIGNISGDNLSFNSSCDNEYRNCTLIAKLTDAGHLKGKLYCNGSDVDADLDLL